MLQSETVKKYDTYKDSGIEWIGEIPQDWKTIKFKYCFSIIGGNGFPEKLQGNNSGDIPFCKCSDINDNSVIFVNNANNYISRECCKDNNFNLIPENSILIAKIGEALKKNHRKINTVPCCIDNNMEAFVFKQNANNLYYFYVLKCVDMLWFDNGGTIPSVNNEKLKNFKLPYIKTTEQQRIAEYLDKKCGEIDRVVETEKAVIEKLKEYKQSIITEAVTKGLDKTVPLKDSGIEWIGKIPQHWEDIKLKFCTYIRARLGWKGLKAEEYVEEGYPLLSAFNIVNSKLIFEDLNFINQYRYDESPEIKLQEQDILLVKDGAGIGKCAIVENMPIPSTVNGSIAVITTNYLLMGKFLYYYFLSDLFQAYIDRLKDGMGVPHLFQSDLKEITIVIPSISEQQQIAEYLDKKCSEIDKAIADKEQVIEKFTEYKKSLIYECVTGKRKVV